MTEFKKGDPVKLKIGGPSMIIFEFGDYRPHGLANGAKCERFERMKRFEHIFDVAELTNAVRPAMKIIF